MEQDTGSVRTALKRVPRNKAHGSVGTAHKRVPWNKAQGSVGNCTRKITMEQSTLGTFSWGRLLPLIVDKLLEIERGFHRHTSCICRQGVWEKIFKKIKSIFCGHDCITIYSTYLGLSTATTLKLILVNFLPTTLTAPLSKTDRGNGLLQSSGGQVPCIK